MTPSSTISGAAPRGVATTGVPDASASIITMPNGSCHAIGLRRQTASPRSSCFVAPATSPTNSMSPPSSGRTCSSKYSCSGCSRSFAGDLERYAGLGGDADGGVHALVRAHPPEEQRIAALAAADGELVQSMPWWITAATGMSPAVEAWWCEMAMIGTRSEIAR